MLKPLKKQLLIPIVAALAILLVPGLRAAETIPARMSPIVTFDPDRGMISRPPTKRPLTPAELKLARERAERMFDAIKVSPSFSRPSGLATFLTSWAVILDDGTLEQSFTAYWSAPRDVRRHTDGAFYGVMGGAHKLLYMRTNHPPNAISLVDPTTREFSRNVDNDGLPKGTFPPPQVFGEVGGDMIYGEYVVFTREGRSIFEPVPVGLLLQKEIQTIQKRVAEQESIAAGQLKQLEATMTPQAIAERRSKRETYWKKETKDPAALAKRLDAAARSDEADYRRQKEFLSVPASRDPKSAYWGPRLALEALQARLASLDGAGRLAQACARGDSAFSSGLDVRFEPMKDGSAPPGCLPLVQVRRDLVDPKQPTSDIQLFTIWFGMARCGERWSTQKPGDDFCSHAISLLREMDWSVARQALGW